VEVKYQAVVLNFDRKTAKYVGVREAENRKTRPKAVSRTGIAPPSQKPKR